MRSTSERGFTLIELLIVAALLGILAAICAHHVIRARAVANETATIGSLRALTSGQTGYAATCGNGYYSKTIAALVDGQYVSPDLNITPKSGYVFTMEAGDDALADCKGSDTAKAFYVKAEPVSPGSGSRSFASNQVGTIWQKLAATAPAEPFESAAGTSPIQ